jgi:hypothetical protein
MYITGYLSDAERTSVFRFIEAASSLSVFREIIPVRRDDGQIIAVAFYTHGTDASTEEDWMPRAVARLSGILQRDTEIASAGDEASEAGRWVVKGRGEGIRGEVVRLELEG